MSLWVKLSWAVAAIQAAFGSAEMFAPSWVFGRVLPTYELSTYHGPGPDLVWLEAEKITRNIGLYNLFLALGLLLTLSGRLGGAPTAQFFLSCVAVAGAFGLLSVSWTFPFALAFALQLGLGVITLIFLRIGGNASTDRILR